MIPIALVRARTTSLGSCFCVFVLGQGLGMETCIFYGKIGCFPLVTYENAQRNNKNRLAGTQVVKPITLITRDVIREFMVHKVLPAI